MKRRTWKLWDAPCSHWTYCPRPLQVPCGWEMDVNDGHQCGRPRLLNVIWDQLYGDCASTWFVDPDPPWPRLVNCTRR